MTAPISLSAFADLARRRGNTAYGPLLESLPTMREVRHSSDGPQQAIAPSATFQKLRNRSASKNHSQAPLDLATCVPLCASGHGLLPERAGSDEPGGIHPHMETTSKAGADPASAVCVPDQPDLARRCCAEIQLLTYRCAIGGLADPHHVRFVICAGRKQKQWQTQLIRMPFNTGTGTEALVSSLKDKWPLVAAFHWGVSSAEITRRLVSSVGATPEDIAEPDPDIDEWDRGGLRFVSGQPCERRIALEQEKSRPFAFRPKPPWALFREEPLKLQPSTP